MMVECMEANIQSKSRNYLNKKWKHFKKDIHYLIILLPCLIFFVIFKYIPMVGVVVAFQNYNLRKGIFNSEWVGLEHFESFIKSPDILELFRNTIILGAYILLIFPVPILFALMLNELKSGLLKRNIQTISYLPFFLSVVVVSGIVWNVLSPDKGLINNIIGNFGIKPIYFMAEVSWFRTIYLSTQIWQYTGYSSIIFIAAISGVPQELYDSAEIDGCNRYGKIWHVTLPCISITVAVMFILSVGGLMNFGFEKALLLQTPATYSVSDIIGTYVYRRGLQELNYSFAAAVGFFESLISLALIIFANYVSKKIADVSIW